MLAQRFFSIAIALALFISNAQAQVKAGGLLGLSVSSLSVNPNPSSEEYGSKLSLAVGGVVERKFSDNIGISAELLVLGKGNTVTERGDKVFFKLTYLEIPIMLRYYFSLPGGVEPFVMAGPTAGFLLSAKAKLKGGNAISQKDETKGIDVGLGIGGGAQYPMNGFTPYAILRYALGLANINNDTDDGTTVKNRGLLIAVGVMLPIGE